MTVIPWAFESAGTILTAPPLFPVRSAAPMSSAWHPLELRVPLRDQGSRNAATSLRHRARRYPCRARFLSVSRALLRSHGSVAASGEARPGGLEAWHAALDAVSPPPQLLVPVLGGRDIGAARRRQRLALLGDALVKVAVLRLLGLADAKRAVPVQDIISACACSVSNSSLSAIAEPALVRGSTAVSTDVLRALSQHSRATAVEAAVALVHAACGDAPIESLAGRLLVHCRVAHLIAPGRGGAAGRPEAHAELRAVLPELYESLRAVEQAQAAVITPPEVALPSAASQLYASQRICVAERQRSAKGDEAAARVGGAQAQAAAAGLAAAALGGRIEQQKVRGAASTAASMAAQLAGADVAQLGGAGSAMRTTAEPRDSLTASISAAGAGGASRAAAEKRGAPGLGFTLPAASGAAVPQRELGKPRRRVSLEQAQAAAETVKAKAAARAAVSAGRHVRSTSVAPAVASGSGGTAATGAALVRVACHAGCRASATPPHL